MSSVPSNTPAPADAAAVAAAKAAVANPSTQPQGQGDAPFPDASVTSPTSVGPTTTTTSLPSDAPKAPTVDHAKLPATDSTKALTSDAFKAPAADGTSTQPAIMPVPADSVKITISDKAPIKDGPDVFHAPDAHSTSIIITPGRPGTSPSETQAPFTPQVPSSNQGPPTSIPLPPPQPSTVSVIQAPLTPDHITIPPKFPPVLGAAGTPSTPVTGNQSHPDDVHKQPERIDTLIDLPGHTPRSRRNSADGGKVKPSNLPLPTRPGYNRAASSSDLRSGLASPIIPPGAVENALAGAHNQATPHHDPLSQLTLLAGQDHKPFAVHRHILTTKVPYFTDLLRDGATPDTSALTFEGLDEWAFALFVRWLYGGALHGPKDFHGFTHYLALYCLALRFGVEPLQDETIDLCRNYYRQHSMTAPAYRLEYVYTFTSGPNHMRRFLITTAAYRSLCDAPPAPGVYISDSMKAFLAKGGDAATDFADALIKLSKDGLIDVRKGDDSAFHVGSDGNLAKGLEPWQDL